MNEPRNLRKAYVEKLRACEISLSENYWLYSLCNLQDNPPTFYKRFCKLHAKENYLLELYIRIKTG